jgi:glycosyltransferase involved in cell wall biosynthesis
VVWTLHDNTFPHALVGALAPIPRRVITVSHWLRDLYGPLGLTHKITVIHNGLPLDAPLASAAGLREELSIPPNMPLVISVGRLVAGKAPHLFVEAAQRVAASVPQACFALVGGPDRLEPGQRPSPYADQLAEVVRESQLGQRLILAGHRSDVGRFYAAANLLVYCSVLPEGLPTVLLEAMRYARPVVASAIGAVPEIVVDGQTGRLVQRGDAETLAEAMLDLLRDTDRARALGLAGQVRLEREFDLRAQAARVMKVYETVQSERR